jgi:hypothetical protein
LVFATARGKVEQVAHFDLRGLSRANGTEQVRLVRSRDARELAVLLSADAWYLYPFAPGSRHAMAPWVITPRALSQLPEACGSGSAGFLVEHTLSVSPHVELTPPADVRAVRARLVVGPSEVCVEGLAARSSEPLPSIVTTTDPGTAAVPLVVSEPGSAARRRRFGCKNMFEAPALEDLRNP